MIILYAVFVSQKRIDMSLQEMEEYVTILSDDRFAWSGCYSICIALASIDIKLIPIAIKRSGVNLEEYELQALLSIKEYNFRTKLSIKTLFYFARVDNPEECQKIWRKYNVPKSLM